MGTTHGLIVVDTRNNVVDQVMATDSKLLSKCVWGGKDRQRERERERDFILLYSGVARKGPTSQGKSSKTDCTVVLLETTHINTDEQGTSLLYKPQIQCIYRTFCRDS